MMLWNNDPRKVHCVWVVAVTLRQRAIGMCWRFSARRWWAESGVMRVDVWSCVGGVARAGEDGAAAGHLVISRDRSLS